MPGYGVAGPTGGRGLLPWSWAEGRLTKSHDYWVATVRQDGRPHLMPVWTDYGVDFLDPSVNATFRVAPSWVFGLTEDDFTGSPTRWTFAD
jgi:hypothetical protein